MARNHKILTLGLLSSLALISCKKTPATQAESPGNGAQGAEQSRPYDPEAKRFPPAPSTVKEASPLTDQSRSLAEVLERGALSPDDCDKYFKGQIDRATTLRCGKWMYFYEHLEVPGAPAKIVDLIRSNAPETAGKSLQKFGLFADPFSKVDLPLGMTRGPNMTGGVETYTFTCASCHFGKTNDGRYVVGSPNHAFEFGKLTLTIATIPELAIPTKKQPEAVAKFLDPIKKEVFEKNSNRLAVIAQAIRLLPSVVVTKVAPPNDEAKVALVMNPAGVMDPYAAPSLNDGVAIPVRMSPLWGIDPQAMQKAGSAHGAMLGSNGGARDLEHIMRTSATISGKIRANDVGKKYNAEKIRPLIEYVLSLTPPKPEKTFEEAKLLAGEQLFGQHCYRCHNGPGYSGLKVYPLQEIGTDPNLRDLVDPENTGKAIFDVLLPEEVTKGVRARMLFGVSTMSRLLHNGSAHSLDELFCVNGPRVERNLGPGHSSAGHMFTCDLKPEEKKSLIYFLESL